MKFARITFPIDCIRLVRRDDYALAGPAQQTRQLLIQGRDALARIDNPHERLRFINRKRCLLQDVRGNDCFVIRHDAAGIDQRESRPVPFAFAVDAIACDAWLVTNNRSALAYETIEQS